MKRLGRFLIWFVALFGALLALVAGFSLGTHVLGETAMTIGSVTAAVAIVAWGASSIGRCD